MTTPKYCPGFDQIKRLSSFNCKFPHCGSSFNYDNRWDEHGSGSETAQCPNCHNGARVRIEFGEVVELTMAWG